MLTAFDLESFVSDVPAALFQDRNAKTADLIQNADWILFAMLDVNPDRYPNSDAVIRFLSEYGDQLSDQKLVVMALNAPYFLDATAMSQLATYLGVYSKTQPFLESAVRALFALSRPPARHRSTFPAHASAACQSRRAGPGAQPAAGRDQRRRPVGGPEHGRRRRRPATQPSGSRWATPCACR